MNTCDIWKNGTDELLAKQKQSHRCRQQTYGYQGRRGSGSKMKVGVRIDIYTLQCIKQITNENLLCSTMFCGDLNGKEI